MTSRRQKIRNFDSENCMLSHRVVHNSDTRTPTYSWGWGWTEKPYRHRWRVSSYSCSLQVGLLFPQEVTRPMTIPESQGDTQGRSNINTDIQTTTIQSANSQLGGKLRRQHGEQTPQLQGIKETQSDEYHQLHSKEHHAAHSSSLCLDIYKKKFMLFCVSPRLNSILLKIQARSYLTWIPIQIKGVISLQRKCWNFPKSTTATLSCNTTAKREASA